MSATPEFPLVPGAPESYRESNTTRAVVTIGPIRLIPSSYEIESNGHGATDTARITVPASQFLSPDGTFKSGPDWTLQILRSDEQGNSNQPVFANIYAGFVEAPNGQLPTSFPQSWLRFAGIVDLYSIRVRGDSIEFSLRSLGAPMTSDRISLPFQNQTTADFVKAMAARYNLTPRILMDPATPPITIQQVLGDEFIAGTRNMRIWDLLLQCALWEDCDIWVDKFGNLWFAAPYLIDRKPLDLKWLRDITELEITHAPQFSKNIKVEVRSYNPVIKQSTSAVVQNDPDGIQAQSNSRTTVSSPIFGTNQTVSQTFKPDGTSSITTTTKTGGATNAQTGFARESGQEHYIFYPRNLQPQDALTLAKKLWRQISQHEYAVHITLPFSRAKFDNMDITALIRLHGTPYSQVNSTNAGFLADVSGESSLLNANGTLNTKKNVGNGGYWPRKITERWTPKGGDGWEIDAVNHTLPLGAV